MSNYELAAEPAYAKSEHAAFAAFLKMHPGVWYIAPFMVPSTQIHRGQYTNFRPVGAWEARRSMGKLAVRYVGN